MLQALSRNPGRRVIANAESLPAPVGGWDAVSALADMKKDRAVVLENWFPMPGSVKVRRGYKNHATGLGTSVVDSLMAYHGLTSGTNKLFAVGNLTIYDVSAEATATATTETGLTNNRWQSVNYTTSSGNHYLWCCNGVDAPRHWNGTVWAQPAITVISATDIINVNVHKQRLWFVLKDSMDAAYLPLDSIAGAGAKFPLGNVMKKGGYLVSMGTWTHDGGLGPDDFAAFISSRGQVAVYQGINPASATDFLLVGVYDIGSPIGYRCLTKVAGDLAIVTIDGVLPMSRALGTDRGAIAGVAITANINDAMNQAAQSYRSNFGWELTAYPKGPWGVLNVPTQEGVAQQQFVMNTLTGSWCKFTGWNANCFVVYNDELYFGGNDGKVLRADFGGKDGTTQITATGQQAYNYYNQRGRLKWWKAIRALLTTSGTNRVALGISTDYKENASLGTPTAATITSAVYDLAIYNTDVYAIETASVTDWTGLSGIGQAGSIHFRGITNSSGELDLRVNGFDILFQLGEFM